MGSIFLGLSVLKVRVPAPNGSRVSCVPASACPGEPVCVWVALALGNQIKLQGVSVNHSTKTKTTALARD